MQHSTAGSRIPQDLALGILAALVGNDRYFTAADCYISLEEGQIVEEAAGACKCVKFSRSRVPPVSAAAQRRNRDGNAENPGLQEDDEGEVDGGCMSKNSIIRKIIVFVRFKPPP